MPIDRDDKKTGWTIQQGALSERDPEVNDPGMTYHRSQLPDPDVAKAWGFAPQPEPQKVYDNVDEALADPNGPEAKDLSWAEIKADVTKVENKVKDVVDAVETDVKDVLDAVTGKKDSDENPANDVDVKPADAKPADAPAEDKPAK